MRSVFALPLVLCGACNFTIAPLTGGDGTDLSMELPDLATVDLSLVGPDLALDPCAPARTPPANVLGVRCAIGNPPVLDGDLSEWGTLDYTLNHRNAQAQSGSSAWQQDPAQDDADCSATFALRWDLTNLYVAMHVNDDIRGVHPGAAGYQPYLDDAVELYLDGNGDRTMTYNADDWQYIVTADRNSQTYKTAVAQGAVPASYFAVKDDATGAGYSVELRVPWSALGANPVVNGRTIGVDFLVDDDDDATMQQLTRYLLWWNMSSTGCNYPSACTSNFGAAQLVGR